MRMRWNIFLWVAAILTVMLLFAWIKIQAGQRYRHFIQTIHQSHQNIQELQALNGQLIAQNQVLELKVKELKVFLPHVQQEIENLNVKLSRTQSFNQTAFRVNHQVVVTLRDSVVYDTVHAQVFDFDDGYFKIHGQIVSDKQHLNLSYQDSLIQVVYRGARKHPWLWIFSPRQLTQRVSFKNPNARIHYSQTINITE